MTAIVRELQEVIKARKPAPDWSDRVIGSLKNEPAFEDMLALVGRYATRTGRRRINPREVSAEKRSYQYPLFHLTAGRFVEPAKHQPAS
jgi:hypothetical protein